MNKDDLELLFEYDRWANNQTLEAVSRLTVEEFTRDLAGAFRSVRDTLLHIIGGEWIWLQYWKSPSRSAAFAAELKEREAALFDARDFPSADTVKARWTVIEREQAEFVHRLTEQSLVETMLARGAQLELAHLMQHLVNHSVYHRGQVALMMRQLGAEPAGTDFHQFLAVRRREPDGGD